MASQRFTQAPERHRHYVHVVPRSGFRLATQLREIGADDLLTGNLQVAVKPNLTWFEPRPGVTTTRDLIASVVSELTSMGNRVRIVESDGGYGTFSADTAFAGHGLHEVADESGAELVNLSRQPAKNVRVGGLVLQMPRVILEETDVIVNMPVPKVHVLTRYTGALKNQWGLIPNDMRLRLHHRLSAILTDLLGLLPTQRVVMDGSYFLDRSGPIEGRPVTKDLVILADDPVAADVAALRLMGWQAEAVGHVRDAARRSGVNVLTIRSLPPIADVPFTLKRTLWNWIALAGFHSRFLTYVGYESPLAGPLHRLKLLTESLLAGRSSVAHHRRRRHPS